MCVNHTVGKHIAVSSSPDCLGTSQSLTRCEVSWTLSLQRYYRCNLDRLTPEVAACWRELDSDRETWAFLAESHRKSANVCLQLFYTVIYIVLCMFISLTDING